MNGRLQQGAKERMEQLEGYSLGQQVGPVAVGFPMTDPWTKWYDYLHSKKKSNNIYIW